MFYCSPYTYGSAYVLWKKFISSRKTGLRGIIRYNRLDQWTTVISSTSLTSDMTILMELNRRYGPDIYYRSVMSACRYGNLNSVKWLYSICHDYFNIDDAMSNACKGGHLKIAKWLYNVLDCDLMIHKNFPNKNFPMRMASANGHLRVVKWLYKMGCDPTESNHWSFSLASANGHLRVAKWLYSIGSQPTADDNFGIRWASRNGHLDVVKWLYSIGCDLTACSDEVIFGACKHGHLQVARALYDMGCKPTNSAMMHAAGYASRYGHLEFVKWLCDIGHDPQADNNYMIREANIQGHTDIVDFLVNVGCPDPRIMLLS